VRRANVEQRDLAGPDTLEQPLRVYRLEAASLLDERPSKLLDFGESRLSEFPQRRVEAVHRGVGDAVGHEDAPLVGIDEAGLAQHLEVLRRVGHRQPCLLRE
jgi:hypothetical protein